MSNTDQETDSSAALLNERLRERYAQAVSLDSLHWLAERRDLSGLFVPAVSTGYLRSSTRLMIVGRETAGWGKLRAHLASAQRAATVDDYLREQMHYHQRKLPSVSERSKFFQFYRAASAAVAAPSDRARRDAPVWANLFCFDQDKTRPDRGRDDDGAIAALVRMSFDLLKIQIELLEPQLIVFTTGTSCDHYLKQHLAYRRSTVHIPRQLWSFELPLSARPGSAHVPAWRTPHPRNGASAAVRAGIVAGLRTGD